MGFYAWTDTFLADFLIIMSREDVHRYIYSTGPNTGHFSEEFLTVIISFSFQSILQYL